MNYKVSLILLLLLLAGGCSSSTESPKNTQQYGRIGTFIGNWEVHGFTDSTKTDWGIIATYPCTTKVTRADNLLTCEITNDSTHEVLWVNGRHDQSEFPAYVVQDSSSIQIKDTFIRCSFSFGDASSVNFGYFCERVLPDHPSVWIGCELK